MVDEDKITNLFGSINSYDDINKLISEGEAEGQYLECKSPLSPGGLSKSFEQEIGKELSGFANTGGGIIIFGVSTDKKHDLDVLTQIEPIGLISQFVKKLNLKVPMLTEPPLEPHTKILKNKPKDRKGIVVMFISRKEGDPVMTTNGKFFLRVGDRTLEMPYETIKRMFRGASTPRLDIDIPKKLIKKLDDGIWELPFTVHNLVTVPAKSVTVSLIIKNYDSCKILKTESFQDVSKLNPEHKMYSVDFIRPVHKGLGIIAGSLHISMKGRMRLLNIEVTLYAEYMNPKVIDLKLNIAKKKVVFSKIEKGEL